MTRRENCAIDSIEGLYIELTVSEASDYIEQLYGVRETHTVYASA